MKIYETCSLCVNYEPNSQMCKVKNERVRALDQELPVECKASGDFIRDINVVLDSYHYFSENETVPSDWKMDMSRLPTDEDGVPIFVMTKRGIERAIPADPSVTLKGDRLLGVKKILTYQGQRELIHDLGVEIAMKMADKQGVPLHVLPGEENSKGDEYELRKYYAYQQRPKQNPADQWKWDEADERW